MQNTGKKQFKLVLTEPKSFDECPKLVDNLKSKKPVIINLEKLENEAAKRCCGLFTHMKSFQYSQKAIGKAVIINTIDKILQNKSANQHRQGRNKNRLKQYAQF